MAQKTMRTTTWFRAGLITAAACVIGIVGFYAAQADSTKAIDICVERVFSFDREPHYKDVPTQSAYTHAVNMLLLIEDSSVELGKFFPKRAVRKKEFLDMVERYGFLVNTQEKKLTVAKNTRNARALITRRYAASLFDNAFDIPAGETLEEFKKNGIKSRSLTKRDAIFILYKTIEKVLAPEIPERVLCEKRFAEDAENFMEVFGGEGTDGAPPGNPQPFIQITPEPGIDPATIAPNAKNVVMNFAPVNPRAGEKVGVKVTIKDEQNQPMRALMPSLILSTGRDYERTEQFTEKGDGVYEAEISSQWAGTFMAGIRLGNNAIGTPRELTFRPGHPSKLALSVAKTQAQSESKKEAVIAATLRDKFGNAIDADPRDLRVTTSLGAIKKIEKSDKEILITVEGDRWGEANVAVSHLTRAVQDAAAKINVGFSGVVLDIPKGISPGAEVSIPAYIFLPASSGKIGGYDFSLQYDPKNLTFKNVEDTVPNDGFDVPRVTVEDGRLRIAQNTTALPTQQVVSVGSLHFTASTVVGSGTIFVPEGKVHNDKERIVNLPESSGIGESFGRWWYDIKPAKEVCLDIWIVEGAARRGGGTVNREEVDQDVKEMSHMFTKAADASICPFFINWTINHHTISAADWQAKINTIGTTTNDLDLGEEANLRANFPGTPECVQIWYVNNIPPRPSGINPIGESYPGNGGVAIEDNGDYDDLTLAHEMMHQLSGNKVLDSPDDGLNAQDARDPGNVMNYTNPGNNITKAQCDLVKQPPFIK